MGDLEVTAGDEDMAGGGESGVDAKGDDTPVVKFVNKYRAKPTRLCDRMYMSCGIYEPLITPNRSMVSVFREAGITVKYEENRDGHNWDNWRDRLQSGLSWLFPGPQKYVYE